MQLQVTKRAVKGALQEAELELRGYSFGASLRTHLMVILWGYCGDMMRI
jgi:hypothetical protein